MKKNVSTVILFTIAVTLIMFGFTACEKFKLSNLQANYHLRKGNGFYLDEKFRKAVGAYEKALELNPDLKLIYFHLATSYAALYKPSKETEENKKLGEKALDYLLKAREHQPENIKIVHALADLYEKLGNFEEAEKCYQVIMEQSKDNPKAYYGFANFYFTHGQYDKAEHWYKERIKMDPENPEGYHYLASHYQDRRMWYKATENHELRIDALIDLNIVRIQRQINQLNDQIEDIEKKKTYIANVKKNKAIPPQQKAELLDKAQKELAELPSEEELANQIEGKKKELADAKIQAYEKIKEFPPEKKEEIAVAFYDLGLLHWNHSYQTPEEYMGPEERLEIIAKGMDVLNKALELKENYWDPWAIIALLYRQKIIAEPQKQAEHMAAWKKAYDKAISLRDRLQRREKLMKQLEQMGEE